MCGECVIINIGYDPLSATIFLDAQNVQSNGFLKIIRSVDIGYSLFCQFSFMYLTLSMPNTSL